MHLHVYTTIFQCVFHEIGAEDKGQTQLRVSKEDLDAEMCITQMQDSLFSVLIVQSCSDTAYLFGLVPLLEDNIWFSRLYRLFFVCFTLVFFMV